MLQAGRQAGRQEVYILHDDGFMLLCFGWVGLGWAGLDRKRHSSFSLVVE